MKVAVLIPCPKHTLSSDNGAQKVSLDYDQIFRINQNLNGCVCEFLCRIALWVSGLYA